MSEHNSESILRFSKLPQYKGQLNASSIAAVMNVAIKNAKRLFNSASILFNNGDYPSSVSLSILAIEEAGKVSILRGIALTREESSLKDYWKNYRNHTEKSKLWNMADFIPRDKDRVSLDDFKEMVSSDNISGKLLDQVKQIGFYTDCLGNANWSVPEEIIGKDFAQDILQIARIHCQRDKTITVQEIELWIECLSPVWMKSMEEMKNFCIEKMLEFHPEMNKESATKMMNEVFPKLKRWAKN